jgi:hypothetical protein
MTSSGLSGVATAASGGAKRSAADKNTGQTTIANSSGNNGEK